MDRDQHEQCRHDEEQLARRWRRRVLELIGEHPDRGAPAPQAAGVPMAPPAAPGASAVTMTSWR